MNGVKLLPVVMEAGFLKILYGEKLNKIFNIPSKSLLNLETSNFIFLNFTLDQNGLNSSLLSTQI